MNKLIVIIGAGPGLQYPSLSPEKLYKGQIPAYGLCEENAGKYWGYVY